MTSNTNLMDLTDERLVAVIREKDRKLYGEIIRRYQIKLTHYLRKFVHDADELEDVLQDVFIKTYKNLYDFNVNKKFSSWIYRIAHNEAVNYIKKHRKEAFSLDAKELEIIDEKIDIKKEVDARLLKNKIEGCLSLMKEKYREPLVLYYFEEKSYEEISDIMRVPRSTVGILIMRGKNILKEFLTK